jgi:hypothetical protein
MLTPRAIRRIQLVVVECESATRALQVDPVAGQLGGSRELRMKVPYSCLFQTQKSNLVLCSQSRDDRRRRRPLSMQSARRYVSSDARLRRSERISREPRRRIA